METQLHQRLADVEARIVAACERAGRRRENVTLVGVTKTVSAEVAATLVKLGVRDLGENRPQELWKKAEVVHDVRWHMIGHMQRNKLDRTLPLVALAHSVDSVRLLEAIEAFATRNNTRIPVLLEMNASGETSKGGFEPTALAELVPMLQKLEHVEVRGLMTMAAYQEPDACRPTFRLLRTLLAQLRSELGQKHPLTELSMGMSNDFEVAIEEGATFVRLGTILFEGIVP